MAKPEEVLRIAEAAIAVSNTIDLVNRRRRKARGRRAPQSTIGMLTG
jgi:hypothetical protein